MENNWFHFSNVKCPILALLKLACKVAAIEVDVKTGRTPAKLDLLSAMVSFMLFIHFMARKHKVDFDSYHIVKELRCANGET